MALEQEDGTGKSNSVTYASVVELDAYVLARGLTLTAANETAKENLLILAMDYLESLNFIGHKYTEAQALQWPRRGAVLDGYYIDVDSIPQLLKDAQMENAIGIDGGTNPLANASRETVKEKVGDIEVEYATGAYYQTQLKAAEAKVSKLVKAKNAVYRA